MLDVDSLLQCSLDSYRMESYGGLPRLSWLHVRPKLSQRVKPST